MELVKKKYWDNADPQIINPLFPLSWDSRIMEESSVQCPNNENNAEFNFVVKASVFKQSNLGVKSGWSCNTNGSIIAYEMDLEGDKYD